MEEGKYYVHYTTDHKNLFITRYLYYHIYPYNKYLYRRSADFKNCGGATDIREATQDEIDWLEACVKADEYIEPIINYEIY